MSRRFSPKCCFQTTNLLKLRINSDTCVMEMVLSLTWFIPTSSALMLPARVINTSVATFT